MPRKSAASNKRPPIHEARPSLEGHIFVSHSSRDIQHVQNIKSWLQLLGLKCWVSADDISDVEMRRVIEESLDACQVFLLVWSSNSLASREVQIEVNHAHSENKPIISLQIDNSEAPKGVNMILRSYQYVPASKSEKESYTKLGILILSAYGLAKRDSIERVNTAWKKHLQARRSEELNKKRSAENWEDQYWELHWDSSRDRVRRLTLYDNDYLRILANQLEVNPIQLKKIKTRYKRRRQVFSRSLQKAMGVALLSVRDILELEKLRLKCCISKSETQFIVSQTGCKTKFAEEDQQPPEALSWWLACLGQAAMKSSETVAPVPSPHCATEILDLREEDSDNASGFIREKEGDPLTTSETALPRDTIQGDSKECKRPQFTSPNPRDAFSGFQQYLSADDPFLLTAAQLMSKAGMEHQAISMAKESLKQKKTTGAYLLIGCTSYLLGYLMDAINYTQLAIATEKPSGDKQRMALCVNTLGVIRLSLSDFRGARKEFESAIVNDCNHPAYLFNLALVGCFLEDAKARSDLDAFFTSQHARTLYDSLLSGGLAESVLSNKQGYDQNVFDELRSLPPLLPSFTQVNFLASKEVEQCIEEPPIEPIIESSDSAISDIDDDPGLSGMSAPDLLPLIWDWRIEEQQLDPSSCFELHACQRRAAELLQEMGQSLLACQQAIDGFSSKYGSSIYELGFLRCTPRISISSLTLKAIQRHSLEGKQTGSPLLHFGDNCFRLRNGFLLFQRGIAICSTSTQFCWYPFNATGRNSAIKISLDSRTDALLIEINLLEKNGISRHSSTYRFSSFLVRANQSLMESLQVMSALLESREAAWMGIRQVIRKEMIYLRLFRQGIMSSSATNELGHNHAARVQAGLGYLTMSDLENDHLFILYTCGERKSLLLATRVGLSSLTPNGITHFRWNELLSLDLIAARVGCHFRINGSRNVHWTRSASEFGMTTDDMFSALSEVCSFIMTLKFRLCEQC